jgi:hypothetical protein
MTCFDTAQTVPVVPVMPPIIVPGGAGTSGEDHHITIRDDGGTKPRTADRGLSRVFQPPGDAVDRAQDGAKRAG